MDLTNQATIYVSFETDPDTNILTATFLDDTETSLGTIEIESSKFKSLVEALRILGFERPVSSQFKGGWNALTNDPPLADTGMDPLPVTGDVYYVTSEGTQDLGSGEQTFYVGNYVIYNGLIWKRSIADGASVGYTLYFDVQTNLGKVDFV